MKWSFLIPFLLAPCIVWCQDESKGEFSGSLDLNGNQFLRDSAIGATGTPQYDNNEFSIEAWLRLKYRISGYEVGLRLEAFNNSNLLNPNDSYSAWGLGRIYAKKSFGKLDIMVGHIYDQIGSGIIFKAYEERALFLDNSLFGVQAQYTFLDNFTVMVMGGKQRFVGAEPDYFIELYDSWQYGGRIEGLFNSKEPGKWSVTPGIGVMTKLLSEDQVDDLEAALSIYTPEDFIDKIPYYTYAFSGYNTLRMGSFAWYIEGAYKTDDTFFDPLADRTLWTGESTEGKFVTKPGYVIYNAFNFWKNGWGASFEYKATKDFTFRADPFASLNRAMINYLPPMSRVNTYRLTSRYAPATQELGELAMQLELSYRPDRKKSFMINMSHINDMEGTALYREIYTEFQLKKARKSTLITGLQYVWYNQDRYQGKPGVPPVQTIVPYVDYLWIFNRKQSIRVEMQYMYTKEDFGSWVYGLAEFSIAPHWIFEISDMWNVVPYKDSSGKAKNDPLHFPTLGVTYTVGAQRFTARYVKQVEGVVCSGGICRLEPAFSGFRLQAALQF